MQSSLTRKRTYYSDSDQTDNNGKWKDVTCELANFVICQKLQKWSSSKMQEILSNVRKELTDTKIELEYTKITLEETKNSLNNTIDELDKTKNSLASTDSIIEQLQISNTGNYKLQVFKYQIFTNVYFSV
jgi:non-homologous end joining protein Ku